MKKIDGTESAKMGAPTMHPEVKRRMISFRMSPWLIDLTANQKIGRTKVIEKALVHYMKCGLLDD